MRNLAFHFPTSAGFAAAIRGGDQELAVPPGETVTDGEWVLAIFEIGEKRRATAAAGRAQVRERGAPSVVLFELRDWERLEQFAEAGSVTMKAAEPAPPPSEVPATTPSPMDLESLKVGSPAAFAPSFAHWRKSDPLAQGPSARVLLVDDDREIREVVSAMLDAVGLAVESTTSAEDALERLRRSPYDLVVLDWTLPGMTGVELCRLLRRDSALATVPVLFLTAHAATQDVVEAFASGADDYVVKPFRAPELGARIFALLRRARMGHPAT